MDGPAFDPVTDELSTVQGNELNQVLVLKIFEDGHGLPLEPGSEPLGKFLDGTEPFAGIDGIADAVYPVVGGAEVGVAAKDGIVKKTGAAACANAPVMDQGLHELPVYATAWVVHQLLNLQLIFRHRCLQVK